MSDEFNDSPLPEGDDSSLPGADSPQGEAFVEQDPTPEPSPADPAPQGEVFVGEEVLVLDEPDDEVDDEAVVIPDEIALRLAEHEALCNIIPGGRDWKGNPVNG